MRNLLKALWFAVNLTLPVLTSWFSGKECSDCRVWTFLWTFLDSPHLFTCSPDHRC